MVKFGCLFGLAAFLKYSYPDKVSVGQLHHNIDVLTAMCAFFADCFQWLLGVLVWHSRFAASIDRGPEPDPSGSYTQQFKQLWWGFSGLLWTDGAKDCDTARLSQPKSLQCIVCIKPCSCSIWESFGFGSWLHSASWDRCQQMCCQRRRQEWVFDAYNVDSKGALIDSVDVQTVRWLIRTDQPQLWRWMSPHCLSAIQDKTFCLRG